MNFIAREHALAQRWFESCFGRRSSEESLEELRMRNLLEMIYEYQRLRAKERQPHALNAEEQVRVMGLHRILRGQRRDGTASRRVFPRAPIPMPVQFTTAGGFEAGEIRDMSAGGLCIATRRPPQIGSRLVLRVPDGPSGFEYVFPCRVVWHSTRSPKRMGVEFDGIPHCAEAEAAAWQRSIRLSPGPADPLIS